ncbi:MAG TPA: M24 family metallopeptidase [Gaiellaceae bacterium]|nr:M24 family metallopeptidase [Gaiellaceae bacterium]
MPFLSRQVHATRLDAMRELMDREQLTALWLSAPDWCFYASNFEIDVLVWERPVLVVVPREGEPFAVLHELSRNHVGFARERGTLWVDDVLFYSELPDKEDVPAASELPALVTRALEERGLAGGRVGVDTANELVAELRGRLPQLEQVPVGRELRPLRYVLTGEELQLARLAAGLTDWAQERYREEIRVGRLVDELDWRLGARIVEEAANRFPGESVHVRLLALSGPESAAPHGSGASVGSRIAAGDVLVNIIVLRLNGVTVENERTWLVGSRTREQEQAFLAATAAQEAAIAAAVEGRPVKGMHDAAVATFRAAGFGEFVCHRAGHGMGIGHGGMTAHDFPHDTAVETRPLRAGELYSVEPGIYLPGVGGFRHDDSVVVGAEPEVLTTTPRDLETQTLPG